MPPADRCAMDRVRAFGVAMTFAALLGYAVGVYAP
jgi:hypothetical protein